MTIATWITAIATAVLALEGITAVRSWRTYLQLGQRKRELTEMKREITLLHHAAWMSVSSAGQGSAPDVDEKVRTMLSIDGWRPDAQLLEQATYHSMVRLTDE